MSIVSSKPKRIILLSTLLLMMIFGATAQAAVYSTATINDQTTGKGRTVNVHNGSASFDSFNESRSLNYVEASIRKYVVALPDPYMYHRVNQPGSGLFTRVSLPASTYYPYLAAPTKKVWAKLTMSGSSFPKQS